MNQNVQESPKGGGMLILTRRVGETVMAEYEKGKPPIEVTVLGVKGNQVRLGFVAPKDIAVHRSEIWERVKQGLPMPDKK